MSIRVLPDKCVEIKIPILFNVDEVETFLTKHHRWLFKRLDAIEDNYTEEKKYVSGEMHYFLGKQYPIEIIASTKNSVIFDNVTIFIYMKNDCCNIESLLNHWYMEQARRVFKECAEPLVKRMSKYNVAPKSFTIKKMKTRWGSCSSKGSISLNLDLIKLPEQCINEVILHELCHLVHFNHSKEFYSLMTAEMPDWKIWKKQLKFL